MQPTLKPNEYKLDGVFNIERYADQEYESSPEHKYHLCRECVVK